MQALQGHTNSIELWQSALNLLKANGDDVSTGFCREEITTHPDYPSLISLIDFLDSGGISYKALRADPSHIQEFNYPVLAHIKEPGDERMHFVANVNQWQRESEIAKYWTGIVVFADKNSSWQSQEHIIYKKGYKKLRFFITAGMVIAFALFICASINLIFNSHKTQLTTSDTFAVAGFGLISLIGLIISLAISSTELGYQSKIVKQVCGTVNEDGCEQVLKSKYAQGWMGVTPGDATVLYFASQYFIFIASCYSVLSIQSLLLLSMAGILAAILSLYIQAIKLRQWCALCLTIAAILTVQFLISLYLLNVFVLNLEMLGFHLLIISLLALVLFPIKQLIKVNEINKLKLVELKKWKLDGQLFLEQWEQGKAVDIEPWDDDLIIGDRNAAIQLTVACNPFCSPCAQAHKVLDRLLERFPTKVKIQMRLLFNIDNEDDKRTMAAAAILKKYAQLENTEAKQMLSDWFSLMDMEAWSIKWKPENGKDVTETLKKHSKWINQNSIAFTPTIFINGKNLPGRYSLSDLELLIPQLTQFGL